MMKNLPGDEGEKSKKLVPALLKWYAATARDLPWRRCKDPYGIWISEIMLQQTQVKTVVPYWERWMRELPDLQSLAAASEEQILKLWEGLGYYSRVRNLHRAARLLEGSQSGQVPERPEELLRLPGVGRYTAGAIASIAFDYPAPVVDGNVVRVLGRVFGMTENPRQAAEAERFWERARELVMEAATFRREFERPCSAFNQGLMELGATICVSEQPKCRSCPIGHLCFAQKTEQVDSFPRLPVRSAATKRTFLALLLEFEGKYLIRKRGEGEINAGYWEFPNREVNGERSIKKLLQAMAPALKPVALCAVKHTITRYRITSKGFWAKVLEPAEAARLTKFYGGKWVTLQDLTRFPFVTAHRKLCRGLDSRGNSDFAVTFGSGDGR